MSTYKIPRDGDIVTEIQFTGENISRVEIRYGGSIIYLDTTASTTSLTIPYWINLIKAYNDVTIFVNDPDAKLTYKYILFTNNDIREDFCNRYDILIPCISRQNGN